MKKIDFKDVIIDECADYYFINKPPYISSLDERDLTASSIKNWAKEYNSDSMLCHRLDKETSGVLVIAKNPEAYRHLAMQFEHREVSKVYHAVSEGLLEFKDKEIDQPILKMSNGFGKIDRLKGKEAVTFISTLQAFKKHTLLECKPVTGRLHQIRIHLAHLKASIAGDEKYGGHAVFLSALKRNFNLKKETEEQPLMKRVALHAYSITFKGLKGEVINAKASYPKDFEVLLRQLEKNR